MTQVHHAHHHRHVRHLKSAPFDYAGLAVGAVASWVGVPGPGEPLLVAAGLLAAKNKLDLGTVLLVAWAAATAGGVAGWLIGLKAGRRVLTTRGPLHTTRLRALEHGEQVFERYAAIAILLTPSWVAGINRVRPAVYLPVNAAAAALWAGGIGIGAYFIGPTVLDLLGDLGRVAGIAVGLAAAAAVGGEIMRRRRRRRAGPQGPQS